MTTIPTLTSVHGPAAMIRQERMTRLFAEMLRKPKAVRMLGVSLFDHIEDLHGQNRRAVGWVDAELIRAEAIAEAIKHTTVVEDPAGVAESTFGELLPL